MAAASELRFTSAPFVAWGLRWVGLVGLSLSGGVYGLIPGPMLGLLLAYLAVQLLGGVSLARGWRTGSVAGWTTLADVVVPVAAVVTSGGFSSPLWWALSLAPLTTALTSALRVSLIAAASVVILAAGISTLLRPSGLDWNPTAAAYAGLLLPANAALSIAFSRVRRGMQAHQSGTSGPVEAGKERRRSTSDHRLSAGLAATLNFERLPDLILESGARALAGIAQGMELKGLLLLVDEADLKVGSSLGWPTGWLGRRLRVTYGLAREAIKTHSLQMTLDPQADPLTDELPDLRREGTLVCVPLADDHSVEGLLVYSLAGGLDLGVERREALLAIGREAAIALQNARRFQNLSLEKERLNEVQEDARKKLARDLHDGPTQSIAAIAMRTNFARRQVKLDPERAEEELAKVEDMARRTTREIRHLLFTLRPLILESQGLAAALYQLAEKVRDTHGQHVEVEGSSQAFDNLSLEIQGALFYIAEEAVNNARKHAAAEHIWIRLGRSPGHFVLEVEDDGVGFNVGAVDANYEQRGSLGMVTMRERAELVEANLMVESEEGSGTRIRVVLPQKSQSNSGPVGMRTTQADGPVTSAEVSQQDK